MKREQSFKLSVLGDPLPVPGEHKFYFLDHNSLPIVWEKLEPILIDNEDLWSLGQTLDSLKEGLQQDAFFLLLGTDWQNWVKFVSILTIEQYPAQKFLHMPVATGFDFNSYLEDLMEATDYLAYRLDCDSKLVTGRGGWERMLHPYGFQRESIRLVASVNRRSYH